MKKNLIYILLWFVCTSYTLNGFAQSGNLKLGVSALSHNTTGSYNTAIGYYALRDNTTGSYNQAFGYKALLVNKGGSYNTATGFQSLYTNSSGYSNTANGYQSLHNTSSSYENTATGYQSMYSTTGGGYNSAYGSRALYTNAGGSFNTAQGFKSLYYNTTGYSNTANGTYSSYYNKDGYANTTSGHSALYNNISGYKNTANGYYSLYYNINGNGNTATGYQCLYSNNSGSFNTGIGYLANISSDSVVSNATAIGYNAIVDASNKVRIGNTSVTSIGGHVGWTTFSDGRYKRDIKENVPGLIFINNLRPVSYTVNVSGLNGYFNKRSKQLLEEDKTISEEVIKAEDAAGKVAHNGFIAQEVEEAAKKLNFEFSGIDKPQNKDGLYGLRYDEFVVPLVKAVQELSKQNTELLKRLEKLEILFTNQSNNDPKTIQSVSLINASLEQNAPNPVSSSTTIRYRIPASIISAQIMVTNTTGSTIKTFTLANKGAGAVTIDAGTLSAGSYLYSLIIDGKKVDTKKMILIR